ncbi:hypothetical protein ElyMa_002765700 [Elysia marginata]|uniref:Uncharacterized protein n=1 Tax=Elysia marginata TaxID=1093978 RepID=A0AAV4HMI0_9GAST|nr:hypothetical protein ElyMa_002765700 [Elysia marginata]
MYSKECRQEKEIALKEVKTLKRINAQLQEEIKALQKSKFYKKNCALRKELISQKEMNEKLKKEYDIGVTERHGLKKELKEARGARKRLRSIENDFTNVKKNLKTTDTEVKIQEKPKRRASTIGKFARSS